MRMPALVIAVVLCAFMPRMATAQSAPPAAVPSAAPPITAGATQSHWTVAGFVGSNFGKSTLDPSVAFGGQVGYLWKGMVGGEVLADFAPSFKLDNAILAENPRTNAYMANAIFALPLGASGQFQPYVSGGLGSIQLVARAFNIALPHLSGTFPTGTSQSDQFRVGTDVGGGLMGFNGLIGFRADVRYYKATSTTTFQSSNAIGLFTESLLSGLDFWRANIGIAIRW
jgi:outer membrane protein with beta-barrel domain